MTDKEFRQILNETIRLYPEYLKRDREILVRNKLELLKAQLKFPDEFITNANAILEKFWPLIQHTTETVIAGTIAVLTAIGMDIKRYNYNQICKKIRCSQSAVLYQIKNKIFKAMHISGFESIQKSREMVKELIQKNIDIKIPELFSEDK